jgi:hypothetical protein
MDEYYCVVTFHSTYHAIRFEKVFSQQGFDVKLMPVPRQISSSCGTAATFPCELWDRIEDLSQEYDIEIDDLHRFYPTGKTKWFKNFIQK